MLEDAQTGISPQDHIKYWILLVETQYKAWSIHIQSNIPKFLIDIAIIQQQHLVGKPK
jgi:hypothetical protein